MGHFERRRFLRQACMLSFDKVKVLIKLQITSTTYVKKEKSTCFLVCGCSHGALNAILNMFDNLVAAYGG